MIQQFTELNCPVQTRDINLKLNKFMRKHDDFRKGGKLSVWIGSFTSEEQLDNYMNLERTFETDFQFEINDRDTPEVTVKEAAVPISQLVDGFSWSETYAESVVHLANEKSIQEASTMVVFINFEYEPGRLKLNSSAPLMFLGVVDFN